MNKFSKVLLIGAAVMATSSWATQPPSPRPSASGNSKVLIAATPHDRLFSVVFHGTQGLAVGEDGLLMSSADGGKSWTRGKAPTDLALLDVATNGTRTIAVGQQGLILVRDGQGDWNKVDSSSTARLLQVDVNAAGLAIAVGAFGTLLKSEDGGNSWASITPDWATLYAGDGDSVTVRDEPTNYVVDVADDGVILIGGEYGQLLRSTDGGQQWTVVHRLPSVDGQPQPTIFSLSIRSDGEGYAVGQAGLVMRTTDGGLSWTDLPAPTGGSLFAVESFDDGQVIAVGMRVGLRSKDHGATWQPITDLDLNLNWYTGLALAPALAAGQVIAVGHSGRVVRIAP
ncbi:YCF48-related protein [Sinimarinibacterium sp. NLF-5-8]|uniref:WD40/YVTN/BNR-like repeat-containing protein n=1 Tax=Sinimarinibacterium sp. NLF-5-8 TaxID=2698684 RepID=UPI00137BA687|nr:YCF48-related protein [Sinimarinibacterium sp. NLF-5-8]QHS11114.1 photosystem I reaction center subunit IX [Sinimarinibacterium sp. NLF-5-8]